MIIVNPGFFINPMPRTNSKKNINTMNRKTTTVERFLTTLGILLIMTNVSAQHVGIGTNNPRARLHVADSNVVFTGPGFLPGIPRDPAISGAGSRTMWYADKAAFRTGLVTGSNWNRDSIGQYSFATGYNTVAKGHGAFAAGYEARSNGSFSVAMGWRSYSNSGSSVAMGDNDSATGASSVAIGTNNNAFGQNSMALGYQSVATGAYSNAIGDMNSASGYSSLALGTVSTAQGSNSATLGYRVISKAYAAVVVGMFNNTEDAPIGNASSPSDRIFQIGNGTSDAGRSNALTVLKNGNMGIGTVTPAQKFHLVHGTGSGSTSNYPPFVVESSVNAYLNILAPDANESGVLFGKPVDAAHGGIVYNNAGAPNGFEFRTNGNIARFRLYNNGNAWLAGTLTQASDARLKDNITSLNHSLEKLQRLNGYHYQWKENESAEVETGLLAQEVQEVLPELVKENSDGSLGVNYSGLIPHLIEGLKQQQEQIEALKKEIESLRNHNKKKRSK